MPAPPTENIYAALFALASGAKLNGSPAFVYMRRRLIPFSQVPSQPALMMEQTPEEYSADLNRPPIIWLNVHFWIYARTGTPMDSPSVVPATVLNNLKDALIAALAPPGYTWPNQTLGGLVSNVWVEGKIDIDEGPLDQQGIVRIPVKVLAMDAAA